MRGKVAGLLKGRAEHGITPAYAGKSASTNADRFSVQDHPRVCGEKVENYFNVFVAAGSPPRVRGKEGFCHFFCGNSGITPACAGKSDTV